MQRTQTQALRDLFEASHDGDLTAVRGAAEGKEDVKDGTGFSGTVTHSPQPASVHTSPRSTHSRQTQAQT